MINYDKIFIEKLNRLIDDHIDNPTLTGDLLCQKLSVSRSKLHRMIKVQTDLSTSLYIRKYRLIKSKELLQTTDLRISEIGDRVGITNPQNFSTYFINEFKVTPTEFRKLSSLSLSSGMETPPEETVPNAAAQQPTPSETGENSPPPPAFLSRRWPMYAGAFLGLLLMLGTGLAIWCQNRLAKPSTPPVENSLAVLPFINLGDPDSNPACEGIMDEIHTSVSLIKNLKVISRTSSDLYKDSKKSIWQIGDELQVNKLVKGSVLKTGNQLQVKVEIINTKEDIRLWGHTYRAAYHDFFTVTEQIVKDVAQQIAPQPGQRQDAPLKRTPTRNMTAYQEYIQGKRLLLSRSGYQLRASLTRFNRVISLDSGFADAYASRASTYLIMGDFGFIEKQIGFKQAEKNALEAIRLDETNGVAYGVLGNLYRMQHKWEQALITFRIALKHQPNDAQINFWYGIVLRSVGRFDEAIHYETKAVALNPLYPSPLAALISTCVNAERYDLARKAIRDGEAVFNDSYMYHYARSFYHLSLRQLPQAVEEMRISDSLSHSGKALTSYRLYLRARVLPNDRFVTELQAIAPAVENYHDLAFAYAGLKDKENCLKYLQLAVDHDLAPDYLKVVPFFAFLHTDPRFIAILRQCHLAGP